jgi:GTPase
MHSILPTARNCLARRSAAAGGIITYAVNGVQKIAVAAGFTMVAWPIKPVMINAHQATGRPARQ